MSDSSSSLCRPLLGALINNINQSLMSAQLDSGSAPQQPRTSGALSLSLSHKPQYVPPKNPSSGGSRGGSLISGEEPQISDPQKIWNISTHKSAVISLRRECSQSGWRAQLSVCSYSSSRSTFSFTELSPRKNVSHKEPERDRNERHRLSNTTDTTGMIKTS